MSASASSTASKWRVEAGRGLRPSGHRLSVESIQSRLTDTESGVSQGEGSAGIGALRSIDSMIHRSQPASVSPVKPLGSGWRLGR